METITAADLVNALEPRKRDKNTNRFVMSTGRFGIRCAFYLPLDLYDKWTSGDVKLAPMVELFFSKAAKILLKDKDNKRVLLRIPMAVFFALIVASSDEGGELSHETMRRDASLTLQSMEQGEFARNREASDAEVIAEWLAGRCEDGIKMLALHIFDRWRCSKHENSFLDLINLGLKTQNDSREKLYISLETLRQLEGVPE